MRHRLRLRSGFLLLLLEVLLLAGNGDVGLLLDALDPGDDRCGPDLAGGSIDDGDTVEVEGVGEDLREQRAVDGVLCCR